MSVSRVLEVGKDVAAAAGIGGVMWSAYAVSGLPVPATLHQVEQRIEGVSKRIDSLQIDQLDGQRAVVRLSRISLRNEASVLEQSGMKTTRRSEIDDQLRELDAADADLRDRIHKLKH